MDGISLSRYFCNTIIAKNPNFQPPAKKYVIIQKRNPASRCHEEAHRLPEFSCQTDIRNPLRYLLITECCFAAYQEWLAPLLIQASPNPLLIALRN